MNKQKDTIFALSTPPGKSALAVIRISGHKTFKIIKKISTKKNIKKNKATFNTLINKKNEKIDQTITTLYEGPKSYTGEDMAELSIHGSLVIIETLTKTLNEFKNVRIAEAGEFTRRAFENNKLDLTQVEAIADLVQAETEAQRKQAMNQLGGKLSKEIGVWSKKILNILANIEAVIDFSEEDLPKNLINETKEQIVNTYKSIEKYLEKNKIGEKIRSGFIVAVLGKTNAGKSTFINKVADRDVSIVTDEPGTTRDLIEVFVDFRGVPVKFFDTAGIRDSYSKAEYLGIEKAHRLSDTADINLVFIKKIKDTFDFSSINNVLFVQSMTDIRKKIKSKTKIHHISSKTGVGINKLLNYIYKKLLLNSKIEHVSISRERHRNILENTVKLLKESTKPKNIDQFAEDIRLSNYELSKISGKKDIEDLLEIIFSDFCIGK